MKKITVFIAVLLLTASMLPAITSAKGSSGGGRSSGGFSGSRSSSSVRSTSTPRTSTPKTTTPKSTTPKAPRVTTKPSASTAKVKAAAPKKIAGKTYSQKGSVVGNGYQPSFSGGYIPPAGSVVYYQQSSMLNWLPFYMIWSSSNAHRSAVVTEPANGGQPAKETVVKEEGTDTMYVINWVISILAILGIIALIVWFVNRKTQHA